MVIWQLSKRASANQHHLTETWALSEQLIDVHFFFKLSADLLLLLILTAGSGPQWKGHTV